MCQESLRHTPKVLIITPRQKEFTYFLQRVFFEDLSPSKKGGGEENYGPEKMTKIKLLMVLATAFVKSHHLCTLQVFAPFTFLFC